jgi:hypothetical protein
MVLVLFFLLSPAEYSSMYMNSYMFQYPVAYSNYNALQRPIVCNSNLVKNNVCTTIKRGENSIKQNAKEMQPMWCPQACLVLKKGGCKDYASQEQWSSRLKRSQPSQHGPGRSGDRSRHHPRLE